MPHGRAAMGGDDELAGLRREPPQEGWVPWCRIGKTSY